MRFGSRFTRRTNFTFSFKIYVTYRFKFYLALSSSFTLFINIKYAWLLKYSNHIRIKSKLDIKETIIERKIKKRNKNWKHFNSQILHWVRTVCTGKWVEWLHGSLDIWSELGLGTSKRQISSAICTTLCALGSQWEWGKHWIGSENDISHVT